MSDQNVNEAQSIDSSAFILPPKSAPPKFTNLPEDGKISVQENNSLVIDIDATDDLDKEGSGLRYSIFPFFDLDLDINLSDSVAGKTLDSSTLSTVDIDNSISIFPFLGDSDADFFTIDEKTGELSFKIPPDFETPVDLNGDNTYNITVRVTDSSFGSDYQSLKIKVTDEPGDPPTDFNYQPIAKNDSRTIFENQSVKINVLANDRDPDGDTLEVDSVQNPRNGSAVINDDNTITYTPNPDFSGNDSFEYKIIDGDGGSDKASVNVFVKNVNQKPNAEDDFAETNEGEAVKINVLANDSDPDGDKLRTSLFPQFSTFFVPLETNGGAKNGKVVLNSDNTITYTPNEGFSGTDTFTYYAIDRPGLFLTATTDGGGIVNGSIDAESTGDITDISGSLSLEGSGSVSGSFSSDSSGNVSGSISTDGITTDAYFPILDFGLSDSATVTVEVKDVGDPDPVNKPPVAVNDSGNTKEGESITIDVLANDSDPDGDSLTIDSVKNPSNGKAVINDDNTITYTPNDGFDGNDSFTYKIADGNGGTDEAKVNIAVEDVVINPPGYTNFIKGTNRNNHLKGTSQNDSIEGLGGWDTLNGNGGDDYLSGGAGLDRLNGGAGADILNGSDSENAGAGERDTLTGGADEDTFILGEANQSYYTDKGNRDFARIKDFEAGIDTVQLSGSIDDYQVKGNQIFLGNKELVAIVENVGSVDLSSDSFEFV